MALDIELTLTEWIRGAFSARTCTELPANLADVLPVVQVEEIGGTSGRFNGTPRVDVDVYAADYESARDLAQGIHDALLFLNGTVGTDAVIRGVRVDSRPSRRPYDNAGLRRVGASYTISARPVTFA